MTVKRPLAIALVIVTALHGVTPAAADANWLKKLGRAIESTANDVGDVVTKTANTIGNAADALGSAIVGKTGRAKEKLDKASDDFRGAITSAGNAAISATALPVKTVAITADSLVDNGGALEKHVGRTETALQNSHASVVDTATALTNATGRVLEATAFGVVGDGNRFENAVSRAGDELSEGATSLGRAVGESAIATVSTTIMLPLAIPATALDTAFDGHLAREVDRLAADSQRIGEGIGAAVGVAAQPENLVRTALMYAAASVAGPAGSALVNVLYEKAVRGGNMTEEEMLKSFTVGLAAGYAAGYAQGAVEGAAVSGADVLRPHSYVSAAASNVTRNVVDRAGNVVLLGDGYTTEEFLTGVAAGLVSVEVGDDFAVQVLESGLEGGLRSAVAQAIEEFEIDLEEVEGSIYEGVANGMIRRSVHELMDAATSPEPTVEELQVSTELSGDGDSAEAVDSAKNLFPSTGTNSKLTTAGAGGRDVFAAGWDPEWGPVPDVRALPAARNRRLASTALAECCVDVFGEIRSEWVLVHEAQELESVVGKKVEAAAEAAEPVIDAAGRVSRSTLEGAVGGAIDGAARGAILVGPPGIIPGGKAGAIKGAVDSFSKSVAEEVYRASSPESPPLPEEQGTHSSTQPEEDGVHGPPPAH